MTDETIFMCKCFRGYPQNMSGPYGNNPYGQNTNPQGGNPYAQGGPGGYPPSGQQPYGNNPYPQNPGFSGSGYPPQGGGYPPQGGGYPPQSGGYPPQTGGYPPQSGGYPPQSGGYPPQSGGYPPQSGGYPPQGGGYGGGSSGGFAPNDPRAQRLTQVIQRYEINAQFAARLQALSNCEIVVLCDDSGSMNSPLQNSNQTRWDELRQVCCFASLV